MRKMIKIFVVISILSAVVYGGSAELPMNNLSFELLDWNAAEQLDPLIPGTFNLIGPGRLFEPANAFMSVNYPAQIIPDGLRMVQIGAAGRPSALRQEIGFPLEPNTTYSFSIKVGSRVSAPFFNNGTSYFGMALHADPNDPAGPIDTAHPLASVWTGPIGVPAVLRNDLSLTIGAFTTMTLNYTSGNGTDGLPYGNQLFLSIEAGDAVIDYDMLSATVTSATVNPVNVTVAASPAFVDTFDPIGLHSYPQGSELNLVSRWNINCPDVAIFNGWVVNSIPDSNSLETVVVLDSAKTIEAKFLTGVKSCVAFPAASIHIPNGDFELPTPFDPGWQVDLNGLPAFAIGKYAESWQPTWPGWTTVQEGGRILYTASLWDSLYPGVSQLPYGKQILRFNSANAGGFEQSFNGVLVGITTYTLELDTGYAADRPGNFGWVVVQFVAGVGSGQEVVFNAGIDMNPASGGPRTTGIINGFDCQDLGFVPVVADGWVHQTLTFTTADAPPGVSKQLGVKLFGGWNLDVDNLALSHGGFTEAPVSLTMSSASNTLIEPNSVVPALGQTLYPYGATIGLSATTDVQCPNIFQFVQWTGNIDSNSLPQTLIVLDEDKSVTANFIGNAICGDECHPINKYDLNADCQVDLFDLNGYVDNWLFPVQQFGINQLVNGGFENVTIDPWLLEGSATVSITNDSHIGTQALRVDYSSSFSGVKQQFAIGASEEFATYRLSFVHKTPVGVVAIQGIRPVVAEFSADGISFHVAEFGWSTSTWQQWIFDFTLQRPGANVLVVIFQGHTSTPGSFIVDAVALEKMSSPYVYDVEPDGDVDLADFADFGLSWAECTMPVCP